MTQKSSNTNNWQFNRQINLSVLIQLTLLASLIIGSWINLQRQLDLLRHDMNTLIQAQKHFQKKCEQLSAASITYEYRLRAIEKCLPGADITSDLP